MSRLAGRIVPLPASPLPELERTAACDVTVAMFSTALMNAAGLRLPAISVMFPGWSMEEAYMKDTGGLMDRYPLAELECVLEPATPRELAMDLARVFDGTASTRAAQERWVNIDGGNARRIAEFVSSL